MLNRLYRPGLFGSFFAMALVMHSCSKEDPPPSKIDPVKISIVPVADTLRNIPITFQATVDRIPDSYKWTFSDGKTSTDVSPTRSFDWGSYYVACTVTFKGVESSASYRLYIKGDARINGKRHFSGHYSFYKPGDIGIPPTTTERDIADTVLEIRSPEPHQLTVLGAGLQLQQDYANIIWYKVPSPITTNADFKYYPANDSTYISVANSFGPMSGGETWTFWRKN